MAKPSQTKCFSCGEPTQVHGGRWCKDHWYPGADKEYQDYLALLDEGHSRNQAMVLSGLMGHEEI